MVSKVSVKLCLPFRRNSAARRLYSWPRGKHQHGDFVNAAFTSANIFVVKACFCSAEKTFKCLKPEVDVSSILLPRFATQSSLQSPFPPPAKYPSPDSRYINIAGEPSALGFCSIKGGRRVGMVEGGESPGFR